MIALRAEKCCWFGNTNGTDCLQSGKGYCYIVKGIDFVTREKLDVPAIVFGELEEARFIVFFIDGSKVADTFSTEMQLGQ